jgi:ankyrin repeat protein
MLASFHAKTTDLIDAIPETGKIDINGVDNNGVTPLHYAIIGSNPKIIVPHLLQKGADPNVADKKLVTPLHKAANFAKDMDIIDFLFNHPDVDVNYLDNWGRNALYYATINENGLRERIANLLRRKAPRKEKTNRMRW